MNRKNRRESEAPCKRHKGPPTKDDCDHCSFRTKIRRGGEARVVCSYQGSGLDGPFSVWYNEAEAKKERSPTMERMRFIRTADGRIIDVSDLELISAAGGYAGEGIGRYGDSAVIKMADSIDKLCDRFGVEDCLNPSGELALIRSFAYAKRKANEAHKLLYGYVIVDKKGAKALEPVAVLNEKGEMELL